MEWYAGCAVHEPGTSGLPSSPHWRRLSRREMQERSATTGDVPPVRVHRHGDAFRLSMIPRMQQA